MTDQTPTPEPHQRGWRHEKTVWTRDTTGTSVPITTGVTTDDRGDLVAALAVGTGPTCTIGAQQSGSVRASTLHSLLTNLLDAVAHLDDLKTEQRRGTP